MPKGRGFYSYDWRTSAKASKPAGQNINRGIVITMDVQAAMRTIMHAYRQVFRDKGMTTAAHLRSPFRVNLYRDSTSVCSFVERALHELTPSDIRDAAVNVPVSVGLHPLNVQFFKSNDLVFVD